jgi:hypothetical protein
MDKIIKDFHTKEKTLSLLEEHFKTKDVDMIYIKIISNYLLGREELKKLWEKLQVHGRLEDMVERYLLNRDEKETNFGVLYSTLLYLFEKENTLTDLRKIKIRVEKLENKTKIPVDDALHYLSFSIGELDPAPIPPWVTIQEGENLSLLTSLTEEEVNYDELLDKATDIFYAFLPSEDKGEDVLVKEKIPPDIRETVQTYLSTLSGQEGETRSLNRVFGPPNKTENHHCPFNLNKRGPCRMLNCACRVEDDTLVCDWFDSVCDICMKKILDKSHALRYPYKGGGWVGVYCSLDCLMRSEFYNWEDDFDQYIRMENLKGSLEDVGIMDRTKV